MRKKQSREEQAKDVVRRLMTRTFGWPDGVTMAEMETEYIFDAMAWIMDRIWGTKPEEKKE